jgi:GTPase SAR1 family protein
MQSKVVFAGLSSAGKTSMLLALGKKFSLLHSVKPTIGAEHSEEMRLNFMGLDVFNWDLGGQEMFRSKYFKQKYRVFSDTTALFYLIDVQDSKTFEESLEYLKNIVQTFRDLNESPTIIICFHKFDPDVRKDQDVIDNIRYWQGVIPSIVEGFESLVFQTSIYEEDSIVRAFSEGVISRSPKSTLIKEQLKEFSKAMNSQVTLVLDENYFLLGSFSSKKINLKICEALAPRFFTIIDRLEEFAIESSNLVCDFRVKEKIEGETVDDQFFICCQLVSLMKKNFGIFCLTKTREAASSLTSFIPNLANNLEKILISNETEKK